MLRPPGFLTRRAVIASLAGAAATASLNRGWATEPASPSSADSTPQRDFNIRDFGAVGNGKADDTAAFRAMHRKLTSIQHQLPNHRLVLHLPAGHYRYSWNEWLWGLRQVSVIGEQASLQCISDSSWDIAKFALTTNSDPLQGYSAGDGSSRPNFGYLIHSVEAGSWTVKLLNSVNRKRFVPGRHVCILSFDQQFGGYPPNCRYFEYAVVEAVSAGTIRLDRPLQFDHSEMNFEDSAVPESLGRARIVPIDWPERPLAIRQEISGIKIEANPHAREHFANVFQAIGFCEIQIQDCSLINLTVSLGQRCEIVNSDVEFTEPDKLVSEVEFRNCHIGWISQATGIHRLTLDRCRVDLTSDMQARYVRALGCEFRGAAHPDNSLGLTLGGFTPTRLLEVTDSVFVGKGRKEDVAVGWNQSIAISLTDPIKVNGNVIRIPIGDKRLGILLSNLEPGDTVLLGGEFAGTTFSDGRSCRVEDITADGTDVAIKTTAPAKPGDVLFTFRVRRVRFHGNQYRDIQQSPPLSLATSWEDRVEDSRCYRWTFASNDFSQVLLSCPGKIERITVDVQRPYRGSDPSAFLVLTTRTPAYATIVVATDLTQAGKRSASASEMTGKTGADLWKPIGHDTVVWDFYVQHGDTDRGGQRQFAGNEDQQANYLLQIETTPFWQLPSFHYEP